MTAEERAPAKLNLELHVLGRRPDGSHEVDTVIQAIDLCDRLSMTPAAESSLEAQGSFAVPVEENLVLQAATAIGLTAHFVLTKAIPPGAGMGGGSSDAAAVLRAAAGGRDDLARMAETLGADVPFFLRGGRVRATGRGELLEPLAVEPRWYALAWPGFEVSTASVYEAWDRVGGDGHNHLFRAALAVEPRLAPFARDLGDGWVMTGSGSAFFRELATEAEARAEIAGKECWTAVAAALDAWG